MRRINSIIDHLKTGRVVLDADGAVVAIPAKIAEAYDSGVRDVSSLLINGWAGTLYLLRDGTDVILTAEGLDGTNATSGRFISLPYGVRARPRGDNYTVRARGAIFLADGTPRRWDSADQGVTTIRDHQSADVLYGDMWMKTIDPPPATPPGTPA